MPTFNQSEYISRAINSLILQSFTNWELIIINDGSTDATSNVLKSYLSDTRIKYFKNKSNIGLRACLNKGISHASHPFIAYLPSDDLYHKLHLDSLYTSLMERSDSVPMSKSGAHSEHIVATQSLVKSLDVGLFFNSLKDLGPLLKDKKRMIELRQNVWEHRQLFCFDHYVERLTDFFKEVLNSKKPQAQSNENLVEEQGILF